MTTETKTHNSARKVKVVSFLCIVAGLFGWIIGAAVEADAVLVLGTLLFFGGFFGFVVGRFME
jgi:hypothetical protein